MKMMPRFTHRGFQRIDFIDRHGNSCSIQESSLASEDAIWFGVDEDFEGRECTRMHLTQEQVKELLPILQMFVETGQIQTIPLPAVEPG